MRKPEWKQANPKDQLKVLIWSIEGELNALIEHATGARKQTLQRAIAKLQDAAELVQHIPEGSWKP